MRMHELLDHDVTLVETITQGARQPIPSSPGLYFVAPTTANVDAVVAEWATKPQYKSCNIFFTSTAPESVVAALQRGGDCAAHQDVERHDDRLWGTRNGGLQFVVEV